VRKIQLSSNWQERDYQDLPIVTRQSQTPQASIKHSDASSYQGYRIKLPSELSQDMADLLDYSNRRLELADAKLPELDPSAYCFTQPLYGKSQNNFLSFFKQFTLVLHKISSPEAYRAVYKYRWRPRLHGVFTGLSLVTLGEIQEK